MLRKFIYLSFFVFFLYILSELILNKSLFLDNFIEYLILNLSEDNYFYLIIINLVYFLTPFPVTPLILFNGFLFGYISFFIIYPIIILDSFLIFIFSKKLIKKKIFKIFFKENFFENRKFKKIKKGSSSAYIFISSRYIFPYFLHNIIYGVLNISWKKFLYLLALSEIPLTYAFIMLGNSLKDFMYQDINLTEVFFSQNFLLPLSIILTFMILIKFIKKNF